MPEYSLSNVYNNQYGIFPCSVNHSNIILSYITAFVCLWILDKDSALCLEVILFYFILFVTGFLYVVLADQEITM